MCPSPPLSVPCCPQGCPQWEAVAAPRLEAGIRAHVLRVLNGGDPAQLRGLGPRRGGRVHAWRQEHGPFRTVSACHLPGVTPRVFLSPPRVTLCHPRCVPCHPWSPCATLGCPLACPL